MNGKRILLLLPAALSPYLLIASMGITYSLPEKIFSHIGGPYNPWVLLVAPIFIFISFILCAVCFILSIKRKWDPLSLAKAAMIIKLTQIPAYLIIFVLGMLLATTIWLIALVLLLAFFDYVFLIMSGSVCIAAAINSEDDKRKALKKNLWIVICQFIYLADVIASVILYFRLKSPSGTK